MSICFKIEAYFFIYLSVVVITLITFKDTKVHVYCNQNVFIYIYSNI